MAHENENQINETWFGNINDDKRVYWTVFALQSRQAGLLFAGVQIYNNLIWMKKALLKYSSFSCAF